MKKKNYILILIISIAISFIIIYIYYANIYIFAFDKIQNLLLLTNIPKRNLSININTQKEWIEYYNLLQYLILEYEKGNISKEDFFLIKKFFLKYNIKMQDIKDICFYKNVYGDIFFYEEFKKCFNEKHYKNNFIINWKEWEICRLIFQKLYFINYNEYILIYEEWFIKNKRYKQFTNYIDFLLYMYIIEVYSDYSSVNILNPIMVNCIILDVYKFSKWNINPCFIAEIYLKFQNKIILKSLYNENFNIIYKNNMYINEDLYYWYKSINFFINEKINNKLNLLENNLKYIDTNLKKKHYIYPTDIIEIYVFYFKDTTSKKLFIEMLYYHIIYYNYEKESFLEICYLISKLPMDFFRQNWTIDNYINFYTFVKYFEWNLHLNWINYNFDTYYLNCINTKKIYILYKEMYYYYYKYNNNNKILNNLKINNQTYNINTLNYQININFNNKEWIYIKKFLMFKK